MLPHDNSLALKDATGPAAMPALPKPIHRPAARYPAGHKRVKGRSCRQRTP